MAAQDSRAVILKLLIALISLLRRKNIRTRAEQLSRRRATRPTIADIHHNAGRYIKNVCARDGVRDSVAKLHVAQADAVRERSGIEINSTTKRGCVVDVG